MNKTFLITYLGCKVNSYENNAIAQSLEEKGYVFSNENPDIIIINTCSVTSTSDKKSRHYIRMYRRLFPNAILCMMGCSVQSMDSSVLNELDFDIAIGNSNKSKIIDYIDRFLSTKEKIVDINHDFRSFSYDELGKLKNFYQTRAYVKIQDGCDNFCSYCLIPYIRGKSRSRLKNDIIQEIGLLLEKGFKEIVLTGIDVASYGKDFIDEDITFSDLLEEILLKFPNLYRIRISSIEESMIDDKFLYLLKTYKNIANHMHLSLQSGSNKILRLMNRKYNVDEFYKKVLMIKEARPDINLTTDVIVGFPSENKKDFSDSVDFIIKCGFSKIHVFPFSERKGTVAYNLKEKVSDKNKKKRVHELLAVSKKMERMYVERFLGQKMEFLIEQYDNKEKSYKGHSSNFLLCSFNSNGVDCINKTVETVINFDNVKIE